jgi:hypothetical protein
MRGAVIGALIGGLLLIGCRDTDAPSAIATPLPAIQACRLVDGGVVHGTLTYNGNPVADGSYVYAILPATAVHTTTRKGEYTLRVLARQCDGQPLERLGFALRAGRTALQIAPGTIEIPTIEVLEVPATADVLAAQGAPPPPTTCDLTLVTVQGRVSINGQPVPDGTIIRAVPGFVAADTPIDDLPATQTVRTKDGMYTLTRVGTACAGFESLVLYIGEQRRRAEIPASSTDDHYDLTL